jgi:hypothetical protein
MNFSNLNEVLQLHYKTLMLTNYFTSTFNILFHSVIHVKALVDSNAIKPNALQSNQQMYPCLHKCDS